MFEFADHLTSILVNKTHSFFIYTLILSLTHTHTPLTKLFQFHLHIVKMTQDVLLPKGFDFNIFSTVDN